VDRDPEMPRERAAPVGLDGGEFRSARPRRRRGAGASGQGVEAIELLVKRPANLEAAGEELDDFLFVAWIIQPARVPPFLYAVASEKPFLPSSSHTFRLGPPLGYS